MCNHRLNTTKPKCRSSVWKTTSLSDSIRIKMSSIHVLLITCTWLVYHQHTELSLKSSSFVATHIQVCVNMMQRRKDISSNLKDACFAAHQSEKIDKAIFQTIWNPIIQKLKMIILKWKTVENLILASLITSQQFQPEVWQSNALRNCKKHQETKLIC